jgi:hypothetical protein
MRTLTRMLKYELKLVNAEITGYEEVIRSNGDMYYTKIMKRKKRSAEMYRDELIDEIVTIKERKKISKQDLIDYSELPDI